MEIDEIFPYGNLLGGTDVIVYSVKDIGAALRAARKQQGLTQRDVADACRCGTRFISGLENGMQTVEMGLAIRVLNTVGLDLDLQER